MNLVLIRFKTADGKVRDVAALRNTPSAKSYVKELLEKYPSYRNGEFEYSRIKYVK